MANYKHPWDRWFDRLLRNKSRRITLSRGKDYYGMPHSMAVQIRSQAAKRDMRVSIYMSPEEPDLLTIERIG